MQTAAATARHAAAGSPAWWAPYSATSRAVDSSSDSAGLRHTPRSSLRGARGRHVRAHVRDMENAGVGE